MVMVDRVMLQRGLSSSRQALLRPTPDPLRGVITDGNLRLVQEGYLSVWDDVPLLSSNGVGVEFSVNGNDLYSIVSSVNADSLELKVNEKTLGVKYGKSRLRLPFVSTFGDVPDVPSVVNSVLLPSDFMAALSETPKFLARTEDKPSLSCVYVRHEENEVMLFATNGIVMYFALFDVEETANDNLVEYLLPIQTVESVSKVFGRKDVRLGISDKGHIFMSGGSTSMVTPGFNGVYPTKALDIVRSEASPMFAADKKELIGLLRLGMGVSESDRVAISQESDSHIKLTFHEIKLESDLYLESATDVSAFERVSLNSRFLLTCLSPMGKQVTFGQHSFGTVRISDGKTVSLVQKLLV